MSTPLLLARMGDPAAQGGHPLRLVADTYDAHSNELYTFALAMTRDVDDAQDLVQEAFTRFAAEIRGGRPPRQSRPWLYRVITNVAISRMRRQNSAAAWSARQHTDATHDSAEQTVMDIERQRVLVECLATLDGPARAALLLAGHGFSGAEIAEALGKSEAATRTLMSRSRVRLRERLEQLEQPR